MRITELSRYNIPEKITGLWINDIGEDLSLIQTRAIKLYHILEGQSLLISSPDTLGLAFLGEIAAVKCALEGKKVVYLFSPSSISDEKYPGLENKYQAFGIGIVRSSRTIRHCDRRIDSGDFGIALIEYEKMSQFLAHNPSLLRNIDLVIAHDIEQISNPDRGAVLEVTLTIIATSQYRPQLIGLLSVLNRVEKVAAWLGTDFICHDRRPVEIREGTSGRADFQYKACYALEKKAAEPFNLLWDESAEILISNVAHLVERGEQIVVFLRGRKDTMAFARIIMEKLYLPCASGALSELNLLEGTLLNKALATCLQKSIAFYHSDLTKEERGIIERHAQKGEIKVIFCTPSPLFGVCLPSATFLLHTRNRRDDDRTYLIIKSVIWMEYENMCWAADKSECVREITELFVGAGNSMDLAPIKESCCGKTDLVSSLRGKSLEDELVKIIAAGLATGYADLEKFCSNTLMGLTESKEVVNERLEKALTTLIGSGIVEQHGRDGIQATLIGRVAAYKGVSCKTAKELASFVVSISESELTDSEILNAVAAWDDGSKLHAEVARNEYRSRQYSQFIAEVFGNKLFDRWRGGAHVSLNDSLWGDPIPLCSRRTGKYRDMLERWIQGLDAPPVEKDSESYHGSIAAVAQGLSWLVNAASFLVRSMEYSESLENRLKLLSERLLYGVNEKGLELARLRIGNLGRAGICRLADEGLSRQALRETPLSILTEILPEKVAVRLKEAVELASEIHAEGDEAIKPVQSDETFICRDRIEITGKLVDKRNLVIINGSPAGITDRSLELLLKFAVALKKDGRGWVHREDLSSGIETTQFISRLRNELRSLTLTKDGKIIENDGTGNYRLSVPPRNLEIHAERLSQHWNAVLRELARSTQKCSKKCE